MQTSLCPLACGLIHITQARECDTPRIVTYEFRCVSASAADADQANVDSVISSFHARGGNGQGSAWKKERRDIPFITCSSKSMDYFTAAYFLYNSAMFASCALPG